MVCQRCALAGRIVSGEGPSPTTIMLVGEGPGDAEERSGHPFVGPAGSILTRLIQGAGLTRPDVYITNIVKCRPPSNRTPRPEEVLACRAHLQAELEEVQPKVIIALGGSAAEALTGSAIIGKRRGTPQLLLPIYRSAAQVLVTYHPAAGLHQPAQRPQMEAATEADLRLASTLAGGKGGINVSLFDPMADSEALRQAVTILLNRPTLPLACDLEWTGAMWPWSGGGRITCMGFGAVVDGQTIGISVPSTSKVRPLLQSLLRHPISYHNAIADLIWLIADGFEVQAPVGDSLLAAYVLGEETLGLKALAPRRLGVQPWGQAPLSAPKTTEEWKTLLRYNATDAAYTAALVPLLEGEIMEQRPKAEALYRRILLPASFGFARGALTGMPMDVVHLRSLLEGAEAESARLGGLILSELGTTDRTLLTSSLRLGPLVERVLQVPMRRTPKTNRISITNSDLEMVDHPLAKNLLALRKLQKLKGTYLEPWDDLLRKQGDGHLHTVYRIASTVTGRTSAESERGGSLQLFPRGRLRNLVSAPPGWVILVADHSQIELRVAAWLAQEKTMIRLLHENVDLHRATAGWVMGRGRDLTRAAYLEGISEYSAGITPAQRQAAKPVNFGLIYGGGPNIVVETARRDYGIILTQQEGVAAYEGFFELYPDFRVWHNEARNQIRQGYVDTPFGLRRELGRIQEREDELIRKYVNTPTQGTASYITLLGLVRLWAALEERELQQHAIFSDFVHDSILGVVREEYVEEVTTILRQEMENPHLEEFGLDFDVPLVVDVKTSKHWE